METITNIISSFDIFNLLVAAFPEIFNALTDALGYTYLLLADMIQGLFRSHPGLIMGTLVFLTGYMGWTALSVILRRKPGTVVSGVSRRPGNLS